MPSHKELLGHMVEWSKDNEGNLPARFIRAEIQRIERMISKLDEGTNPEKQSAGASAAASAALASPRKDRVAEPGREVVVPEGRPVDQQPRSFDDAAKAAHEHFMAQVSGGKES